MLTERPRVVGLQLGPEPPGTIALPEPELDRGIREHLNGFHVKVHGRVGVSCAEPYLDPLALVMRGQDARGSGPIHIGAFPFHESAESSSQAVSRIREGVALDARLHTQMIMGRADGLKIDVAARTVLTVGPAVGVLGAVAHLQLPIRSSAAFEGQGRSGMPVDLSQCSFVVERDQARLARTLGRTRLHGFGRLALSLSFGDLFRGGLRRCRQRR